MKVLYFVGFHSHFTGSQRSLALMVSRLPPEIEKLVLFSGEGKAVDGFRALGIPTAVIPAPDALNADGRQLFRISKLARARLFVTAVLPYAFRLLRLIRNEKPDVVHCNDSRAVLLIGWAARLAGKPVVWHLRGENVLQGRGAMDHAVRRLASVVVTVADAVQAGVHKSLPVRTIYNGIDPADCHPSQAVESAVGTLLAERGFDPASTVRLLTASSLVPYKGLHHLQEALRLLFERRPELKERVVWLVLGAANTAEKQKYCRFLQDRSAQTGLERNLFWLGWQDNAYAWVAAADVTVLPTIQHEVLTYPDGERVVAECGEGFPRVILESLAAGKACVATDVAGVCEMVRDGETGRVVPPADPAAIAAALECLLDDPEYRQRLGRNARASVTRFTLERTVEETTRLYHDLLGGARPRQAGA
jgi:glycosyltransferase involved in cell wall biosynthesis